MPATRLRAHPLLLLCLLTGGPLGAGEAPATPAPTAAPVESPLQRETRQYVAQLTEQRNQLRDENEALRGRQGLLLIYGGVLTLLSGWLILRALTRPAGKPDTSAVGTDAFAVGTTVTVRKNATITIRNGSTQQAEVTDQVQTRRAFARSETATHTRQPVTTRRETRPATTPTPTPAATAVAPELDPTTPVVPITTRRHAANRTNAPQAPATVRVEQQSDRLVPVEVAVKPGTAPIRR